MIGGAGAVVIKSKYGASRDRDVTFPWRAANPSSSPAGRESHASYKMEARTNCPRLALGKLSQCRRAALVRRAGLHDC